MRANIKSEHHTRAIGTNKQTHERRGRKTSQGLSRSCIRHPTVLANLPIAPRQRAYAPHLDHRRAEVSHELAGVLAVVLHQGVRVVAPVAPKQLLVRMQQPLVLQQTSVVTGVEDRRGRFVQRRQLVVSAGPRASRLEGGREVAVDGGGLVVEPIPEQGAPSEPEGVSSGEGDEVLDGQAVGLELRQEVWQAGERRGDVGVCVVLARRRRVSSAK